jgi:hypothetical protein
MLHDGAQNGGLEMLPIGAILGNGDEIIAVKHAGHALNAKQFGGERRHFGPLVGVAEICGA